MHIGSMRLPLRQMSIIVLLVLVAATLGLFVSVRSIINDEQTRLLHERATEAGTLVDSLFEDLGTSLSTLTAPSVATDTPSQFADSARPFVGVVIRYIAVVKPSGASYQVADSVGTGPAVDTSVSADRAALATQALGRHGLAQSSVATSGGHRLSFAAPIAGGAVLEEDLSFDSTRPIDLGKNGPFSELNGVVYAGSTSKAPVVLTTTSRIPLRGHVASAAVPIGEQHWLLVVSSRGPLVGAFASRAPWGALGGGLALAVLVTLLVEVVARRRSYALALVDERTRDLLEAREAAEAANRAKSEFLSRMSHELRTPLNAILGFGQLLQLEELPDEQKESVQQILKGGRHLLGLINEVLDISRIDAGTLTFSPEAVSVDEAIDEVMTLMRPLAGDRHITLRIHGSGSPSAPADVHVKADRQRLKQIMLNLVSNAVKYTGVGGTVEVSTELIGDDRLRIVVSDNGPGIREKDRSKLFVPFERLGAEATGVEGTGVGLALSRRLAEAMGGKLDLDSFYGSGCRFWVELPLAEAPLERYERLSATEGAEESVTLDGDKQKVLYIEDNPSNLLLIERVINLHSNLELVPAMQGRIGIELAREHHPAVVLLDLHLPDVGGDEVLRVLRLDPATCDIPVVVLSADATPSQVSRLLAGGASAYLTKPVDVVKLIQVLGEHIPSSVSGRSEAAPSPS